MWKDSDWMLPASPSAADRYLRVSRALWTGPACDAQRAQRPVRPLPGKCCSVSPTCGESAWRLHVLQPDPGPAGPSGPSAAWFQTERKEEKKNKKQKHYQEHFRIHPAASISNRVNTWPGSRSSHSCSYQRASTMYDLCWFLALHVYRSSCPLNTHWWLIRELTASK